MDNNFDLTINVMMVGGRRCGKTSVLAAMQSCFEERLGDTSLVIGPADFDMLDIIEVKQREMKRYFLEKGKKKEFIPDNTPTEELCNYPFYVGLKNKQNRIRINFIDFPGEWLNNKDYHEDLLRLMKASRILLIAIDTPHLMEQKGRYNDSKNLCRRVSEMVKNIGFADANKGPGLILFVPLKCERYYKANQMGTVSIEVQKAYKPLLQYLQQPGSIGKASPIAVAITPILTMGGAEFSRFQRNSHGEIEVDEKWDIPTHAIYHFPDMNKDEPEPLYCEQPLLYILSFALGQAEQMKNKKKLIGLWGEIVDWVQTSFWKWPSAEDYLKQAKAISKNLKREDDGYEVLNKGDLKL